MRLLLPLLFDALTWIAFVVVHGIALAAGFVAIGALGFETSLLPGATGLGAMGSSPGIASALALAFVVLAGFFVYLHVFVLTLGLLKRLVQPSLGEGKTPVGPNRAYIAWGLNSVLQAVYLSSPFLALIQLLFSLRYLHLRLFGMQVHLGSIVGLGSELRQVELIELGQGSTIGLRATLSCHLSVDGKSHRTGRIRIGNRSLIGAYARVGPGVTIGDDVLVGGNTSISEDVVLEDGVRMGADCFVRRGTRIGKGARIDSGSVVVADVPAGARVTAAPCIATSRGEAS